ncbi:effector binding domain-containing protein [Sedimentibacter sp. zth1]|uniref:effector binding domain-containing protein n=1 Tax=Sedimentibacter sp. zth1 TaxID=2816908 RepID=UPI001A92CC6A|nr:effector binding domain-containing protein [Sedimentibacter sp. zth1]QSX07226.1 effector binding domain-containing protein [Sedimentibacter sp. zth1]
MKLMTISKVSKGFGVSTRTLRYYEQLGILKSQKKEGYAYRTYDEAAVRRLQQIIVLRKLRIPLKQIDLIFQNDNLAHMVDVFQDNISKLDSEITALSSIRSILQKLTLDLSESIKMRTDFNLLSDKDTMKIVESLSLSKINFKEKNSMEELNKASEELNILKNVRKLYLPPQTVASAHFIGENPEDNAYKILDNFIRSTNLHNIKPDLRIFGFNNPSPQTANDVYGYEFWVTIPADLEVPSPLNKKHFEGGLYGAHSIRMGDFSEWKKLYNWALNNEEYDLDIREPLGMEGSLEEHLNAYYDYLLNKEHISYTQLDLLIPIKPKDK